MLRYCALYRSRRRGDTYNFNRQIYGSMKPRYKIIICNPYALQNGWWILIGPEDKHRTPWIP